MYDSARGWSLSFGGCGFLGFYHIGVTRCLSERAPHLLRDARMFFGASSGALHCVSFVSGIPLDGIIQSLADIVSNARRRNIGALHPSFNLVKHLREQLHRRLPADVHALVSGRICISLTRVPDGENVLVSDFQSKDEVVDALICSCFLPFYCGLIPPSFRGVRYVDGGLSDNVPFSDAKTTITVSPFYGEYDICPKVKSTNFFLVDLTKLNLRLCSENVYLLTQALFPPDLKVLGEFCFRGYLDALRFLEENGVCNTPRPRLNLSLGESEVLTPPLEPASLESPPKVAAWGMKTEGDGLPSPLPWEESAPVTLSPKLARVLSEALRGQQRGTSKIRSFLPVKVLSYAVLPWTLPVESAIALVQRLVLWLPDIPKDIRWLQWVIVHVCSRGMSRLFPKSRPQIPASGWQPSPGDTGVFLASGLPGGPASLRTAQQSGPPVRLGLLGPGWGKTPPPLISSRRVLESSEETSSGCPFSGARPF